ncbi:sensor histidine kinase [Neolewinella antarctica]|uniref:Sensor histidine kinase YesM n=1 Tax=Neolewinella antarctica TaxID=442734 RepID=A0ABX0XDE9_9BACT|nr:histidine kinase [Neolewinella antarctica]NJC27300.1 sensor histidine kinase YesM [Neolewinella antarctica]
MSVSSNKHLPEEAGTFLDNLGQTLTQRPFYHAGGWLAFLLYSVATEMRTGEYPLQVSVSSQLINLVFYAMIVYVNLLYFFPKYLKKGQFWTYLLLLSSAAMLLTPLKLILKYVLFSKTGGMRRDILENLDTYFLSMFLVAAISTVGKIMVDWIVQNRKKDMEQKETMQSELRFLKSQINPHFLFNTLNSLYALTLKKDDKAPDIVIKLSEMMRYMLYECNEPKVPLSKEVNYLQNYLDLERLRQRKGIDIKLTVEGNVSDQMLAPLIFIPFLENSFKHGLNTVIKGGFVHALLKVRDQDVTFVLENSRGSVMPSQLHGNRPSGGIGLVNVRRRLELLYPGAYELSVAETPSTYTVTLNLALQSPLVMLPPKNPLNFQPHAGLKAFHP